MVSRKLDSEWTAPPSADADPVDLDALFAELTAPEPETAAQPGPAAQPGFAAEPDPTPIYLSEHAPVPLRRRAQPPPPPPEAASLSSLQELPDEPRRRAVDLDAGLGAPGWFSDGPDPIRDPDLETPPEPSFVARNGKALIAAAVILVAAAGFVLKVGVEPILVAGEGLVRLIREGVHERPKVIVEETEPPPQPDILARLPTDLRTLLTSPEAGSTLAPFRFGFAVTPDAFCRSMAEQGFANFGWLPLQEGGSAYECMSDLVEIPNPNGTPMSEVKHPAAEDPEGTLLAEGAEPVPAPQPLITTVFFAARGSKIAMDTIRFKLNLEDRGVRTAAYEKLHDLLDRAGKTIAWTPPDDLITAIKKREKLISKSRGVFYQVLPEGGPVERINVVLTLKEPPEILPTVLVPKSVPRPDLLATVPAPTIETAEEPSLVDGVVPYGQSAPTAEERRKAAQTPVLSDEIDEGGLTLWQPSVDAKPLAALPGTEASPETPTVSPGAEGLPASVTGPSASGTATVLPAAPGSQTGPATTGTAGEGVASPAVGSAPAPEGLEFTPEAVPATEPPAAVAAANPAPISASPAQAGAAGSAEQASVAPATETPIAAMSAAPVETSGSEASPVSSAPANVADAPAEAPAAADVALATQSDAVAPATPAASVPVPRPAPARPVAAEPVPSVAALPPGEAEPAAAPAVVSPPAPSTGEPSAILPGVSAPGAPVAPAAEQAALPPPPLPVRRPKPPVVVPATATAPVAAAPAASVQAAPARRTTASGGGGITSAPLPPLSGAGTTGLDAPAPAAELEIPYDLPGVSIPSN